jgi:hypothetical protein
MLRRIPTFIIVTAAAALCVSCAGFPNPDKPGPAPFYLANNAPRMSDKEAQARISGGLPGWQLTKAAEAKGGKSRIVGIVTAAEAQPGGVQIATQEHKTVMLDDPNVRIFFTRKLSPIIHVGEYTLTTTQARDERDVRLLADSIKKFTDAAQAR